MSYILFFCLILILTPSLNLDVNINQSQQDSFVQQKKKDLQIDEQRLQQINLVIKSYFRNCQMDEESQVLYNCSILKENYGQFLYGLFHKELILSFLKLYQLEGKLQTQNEVSLMYKIGQKVHDMVVRAYNDWIQIYKPNQEITVEEMYSDIPQLDVDVLDIIQHHMENHSDYVNVLRKIYKIRTGPQRYIIMGNKSEQEIAEDYSGILQVYFGQCRPLSECTMPLNRFIYFVKELSFYITPLIEQHQNRDTILVSEDMDFRATQFLISSIQKIKPILGLEIDYSELEEYSQNLVIDLFQYLKDAQQLKSNPENKLNRQHQKQDSNQNKHQL